MIIEIGDTVSLTATAILSLAKTAPELCQQLLAIGTNEGHVVDIQENTIYIDIGQGMLTSPIAIEAAANVRPMLLQIVRKNKLKEQKSAVMIPMATAAAETIKLAQWTVGQFLQLKQYAITQDLARVDDEDRKQPDPGDDQNWESGGVQYRPVKVELSPGETQLYNTAMRQLQLHLEGRATEQSPPSAVTVK